MNILIGMMVLLLVGFMTLRYRPGSQSGRALLAMTAVMGIFSLLTGKGNWLFQTVQLVLQAVVAFCCFAQLRREALLRYRRMHRHPQREQGRLHRGEKTCA